MKVLVDGDACNKLDKIERISKSLGVAVVVYSSVHRNCWYSEIHYVAKGKNEADFAIIKHCKKGDIVITKDSGLAVMALSKNAYAISPNGNVYTNENFIESLNTRYFRQAALGANKGSVKGLKHNVHNQDRMPFGKVLATTIIMEQNSRNKDNIRGETI